MHIQHSPHLFSVLLQLFFHLVNVVKIWTIWKISLLHMDYTLWKMDLPCAGLQVDLSNQKSIINKQLIKQPYIIIRHQKFIWNLPVIFSLVDLFSSALFFRMCKKSPQEFRGKNQVYSILLHPVTTVWCIFIQ